MERWLLTGGRRGKEEGERNGRVGDRKEGVRGMR